MGPAASGGSHTLFAKADALGRWVQTHLGSLEPELLPI